VEFSNLITYPELERLAKIKNSAGQQVLQLHHLGETYNVVKVS
jgi:hypothetical protein